jgi:carboxylesterase
MADDNPSAEPTIGRRALHILGRVALIIGALLVTIIGLAFLAAAALPPGVPEASPDPAASYSDALARVADMQAKDGMDVAYGTIFMGQGSKTTTAVVLLHGYTNNPEQFRKLGEKYHAEGYNVLIPRLPGHGMRNVMTRALSEVDATALIETTDEAVDIAAGLGENVEVAGLSGGGTLAIWAGYNRDEVTSAVPISPFMEPAGIPVFLVRPITEIVHVLPDIYMWWDPSVKENHVPPDAYPRFSLHSLSAFLDVGTSVVRESPDRTTTLARAVYISNGADDSVNEQYGDMVFERQVGPMADAVLFHEFAESHGYAHDLIDPKGLNAAHIEDIYAKLYVWLGLAE